MLARGLRECARAGLAFGLHVCLTELSPQYEFMSSSTLSLLLCHCADDKSVDYYIAEVARSMLVEEGWKAEGEQKVDGIIRRECATDS